MEWNKNYSKIEPELDLNLSVTWFDRSVFVDLTVCNNFLMLLKMFINNQGRIFGWNPLECFNLLKKSCYSKKALFFMDQCNIIEARDCIWSALNLTA